MRRSAPWIAAAVIGCGWALAMTATATSTPAAVKAAPNAVAVLDLEKLFRALDERTALATSLERKKEELQAEPTKILEEMKRIDETLNTQTLDDEEALGLRARLFVLNAEHQAKVKAANTLMLIEDGRINRVLYQKTLDAIEVVAARDGIDLVLLDDRGIPIPDGANATTREVQASMLARQVLFATESIDITQAVTVQMNNDYAMGR